MTDKLPFLSDAFHFAIANVAVRSSQMEHHIEQAIASVLLEQQHMAEFLLKNMGQDRVVKALQAALQDAFPNDAEAIRALIAEIVRVREERNEILHFIWGKSDTEDDAIQASFRPFREQKTKTKTASGVQRLAADMLQVVRSLIDWQERLFQQRQAALRSKLEPQPLPLGLLSASSQDQK